MEVKPKSYDMPASKKAKTLIRSLITLGNYSLTLNINTRLRDTEDLASQYKIALRDIVLFFNDLFAYVPKASISVEFNKNEQIHFHCYFATSVETPIIVDLIKFHIKKYKKSLWILEGHGWKLKIIDEITQELLNYVFKDEERTLTFQTRTMGRFIPKHIYIETSGNIFLGTKVDNHNKIISINDFIKKHMTNTNYYDSTPYL
jgi:hypothetical protein